MFLLLAAIITISRWIEEKHSQRCEGRENRVLFCKSKRNQLVTVELNTHLLFFAFAWQNWRADFFNCLPRTCAHLSEQGGLQVNRWSSNEGNQCEFKALSDAPKVGGRTLAQHQTNIGSASRVCWVKKSPRTVVSSRVADSRTPCEIQQLVWQLLHGVFCDATIEYSRCAPITNLKWRCVGLAFTMLGQRYTRAGFKKWRSQKSCEPLRFRRFKSDTKYSYSKYKDKATSNVATSLCLIILIKKYKKNSRKGYA